MSSTSFHIESQDHVAKEFVQETTTKGKRRSSMVRRLNQRVELERLRRLSKVPLVRVRRESLLSRQPNVAIREGVAKRVLKNEDITTAKATLTLNDSNQELN